MALSEVCDWIGVMAYDFFGSWDGKTGFVAPFKPQSGIEGPAQKFNVVSSLNWYEQIV